MNIILLNPPNKEHIQRRYMCSYNAPNMLLPPQELMALGGILREIDGCNAKIVDCIADNLDMAQTLNKLSILNPDLIVSIQGFECFEEDMAALNTIKQNFPHAKLILFGHYATLFPADILSKTKVDIIILGEPDVIFESLVSCFLQSSSLEAIGGIAYRTDSSITIQKGDERIIHPERLPMPAYELISIDKYFEPFLPAPLGLIQSARGCPYSCNYCVRSFGKRLTYRTTDQIIEEILFLKNHFGIRSLRFIDDTFTVHPKRVIDICKKIIDLKIDIEWTCLSRVDTLREEMIPWMKKAGCKRIYFGVESGSEQILKYLNKETDLSLAKAILNLCKKQKIETLGFFIVGTPAETDADFNASVNFAIEADFDFIAVSRLTPYPGTALFDSLKDEIDFSLLPYKNKWRNEKLNEVAQIREKEFYKRFYYRPGYVTKNIKKAISSPIEFMGNIQKLSMYMLSPKNSTRADYL